MHSTVLIGKGEALTRNERQRHSRAQIGDITQSNGLA
jgi:hypothetical protein|nr:MAG TPA: hypothetical protein [Caudoviricetes sp.]